VSYQLEIKPSARKELESLDDVTLRRVDKAILKLAMNPRPHGATKLTGTPLYRIRVGTYRVVYEVDDSERRVTVNAVRHRRDVYRR
jgi:mRNA interferase RelE/StbE